jgi:hypothetical protein
MPIKVSDCPKGTSFVGIRFVAMVKTKEMVGHIRAHSDLAVKIMLMTNQVVR